MYKQAKPFFMIVQTPLHAGSGQDLGIVDQPIQRERHTSFPKIEGSSLKGAIREVFEEYLIEEKNGNGKTKYKLIEKADGPTKKLKDAFEKDGLKFNNAWMEKDKNGQEKQKEDKEKRELNKFNEAISLSFGPEDGDAHAGALGFTDARLLLFPVKSMKGVFAYITCPYVLERFKEDLILCFGKEAIKDITCESVINGQCYVSSNDLQVGNSNIILEEYTFKVQNGTDNTQKLAKHLKEKISVKDIEKKLVILSNDDFKDFVNLSTEVITRTKINPETGTVQSGALFTEEYLPAESILYSLALTTPIFIKEEDKKDCIFKKNGKSEEENVMKFFELGLPDVMQIGGNATIGKGIVRTAKWNGGANNG
jgi:CRISPR-associated protein Cmr4